MNKTPCFLKNNFVDDIMHISIVKKTLSGDSSMHWHEFFEIELILSGKGSQILNGNMYELKKGSMYFLTPNDFHQVFTDGDIEVYNIMFDENCLSDEILMRILNIKKDIFFNLDNIDFERAAALCKITDEKSSDCNTENKKYIYNILECIIYDVFIKMNISQKAHAAALSCVQKAVQYIHIYFRENPSLKTVSDFAGLNPNYFSTVFHESMGQTYIRYLTELKLNYALRMLTSSDLPVTDICYASGFNSMSNFLKLFKQEFGKSPKHFRNN